MMMTSNIIRKRKEGKGKGKEVFFPAVRFMCIWCGSRNGCMNGCVYDVVNNKSSFLKTKGSSMFEKNPEKKKGKEKENIASTIL